MNETTTGSGKVLFFPRLINDSLFNGLLLSANEQLYDKIQIFTSFSVFENKLNIAKALP